MKIIYANKAISDLKRLHEFVEPINLIAANETSLKLIQAIERLVDFPMLGREVRHDEVTTSLRELITGKYVIRYVVLENEIHVVRIWHGKEDYTKAKL